MCADTAFAYPSAYPANNAHGSPPQCASPPDQAKRTTKIAARHALGDATAAKNFLSNTGPVGGCLEVNSDCHHGGGVYHPVSGALAGGRCVLLIGHTDIAPCGIIKNS